MGAKLLSELLVYNETLAHLNLSYNDIGDDGLIAISAMLQVNPTLQSLFLAGCGIGNRSFISLCTVMHTCESIRTLDISDNQSKLSTLTQSTVSSMMSHLSAMLVSNKSLVTLNVSKLGITVQYIYKLL